MQKSSFTTVVLIAILLTGAISTALPPMIVTEAYAKPDKKASPESHDVKSPKKIKIIDCNNRNINAEEIEEFSTIEPVLNKAFNSNSDKINNPEPSQVIYLEPDTMIIFNCNNQNHNLHPIENAVAEADKTGTPFPSIQQNNPTIQQNNPTIQQNSQVGPAGDPMLQLQSSLSPIL
jgi:hypothetical protein